VAKDRRKQAKIYTSQGIDPKNHEGREEPGTIHPVGKFLDCDESLIMRRLIIDDYNSIFDAIDVL
jgi:hypothetical protein